MVANETDVFVCHRPADSASYARRLCDVLADRLGPDRLTLDTDALDADAVERGTEFVAEVQDVVGRSDAFLAVIGPQWLSAVDDTGRRRIDDPADWVRVEIEAAVRFKLPMAVVLVGGAVLPRPDELPESLQFLAGLQAIAVSDEQFEADVGLLSNLLSALVATPPPAIVAAEPLPEPVEPAPPPLDVDPQIYVDENVQFTVYRPRTIQPARWSTLLAFAHLAERRPDEPNEPDPLDEVRRQAQALLGEDFDAFADLTQDSSLGVPREGEITFLPDAPGVEFNPVSRTFRWLETVHREEFRLRATTAQAGETIRGRLSVFLGVRLLAEIQLQLHVAEPSGEPKSVGDNVKDEARPYRKIFASYSHLDVKVAEQYEHYAVIFGDRYLRDWIDLRAGENWSERLEELIREADVFQLFWSSNSMRSKNVRREWEYALSLNRPYFIRPTYWEVPIPRDGTLGLPPLALTSLHFQRLALEPVPTVAQAESPHVAEDIAEYTRPVSSPEVAMPPAPAAPAAPSGRGAPVALVGLLVGLVFAALVVAALVWGFSR